MHKSALLPSASISNGDSSDDPVLRLLPPGALIPPRYRQVREQLLAWETPAELHQLGLVMHRIERGTLLPAQIAPLLGPAAAEVAAALALFGNGPRLSPGAV